MLMSNNSRKLQGTSDQHLEKGFSKRTREAEGTGPQLPSACPSTHLPSEGGECLAGENSQTPPPSPPRTKSSGHTPAEYLFF